MLMKLLVVIIFLAYLGLVFALLYHHRQIAIPNWLKYVFFALLLALVPVLAYISLFVLFFGYNS